MAVKTWVGRALTAVVLVAILIAVVIIWHDRSALINYAKTANVVQCLHEDGGSFSGSIENTVFDERRGCHAMTYQIPRHLDYAVGPSYGRTRESLRVELPYTGEVSGQLYQIHGVRGNVRMQIWPSDFEGYLKFKRESSNKNDSLQEYEEDERFLVSYGVSIRWYFSVSDDYPFHISCTMKRKGSEAYTEHFLCTIRTETCNGLMLSYTTHGNPFNRLDEVNSIHQRQVRPLFEYCD